MFTTALKRSPYDREILALAVPALGALVAEPLYILADTAVVGHIGTNELAGLALASQILLISHAIFIFLSYGTTAAVGRLLGAGRVKEAAHQAVQSIWLAFGLGLVLTAVMYAGARPALQLLGGEGATLEAGFIYLRVSTFGIPAMLVTLAGVGYLRGQRDTKRPLLVAIISALINLVLELILIYVFDFGIGASALSTVVAQWLAAGAYLAWITRSVRAEGVSLAIDWQAIGSLAIAGRDLFFRTSALKGSLLAATAAAAHLGTVDLAAHQVTFEIWALLALSLDAIAIAGQAIVANRLGAGDAKGARAAAARMMTLGVLFGFVAAALVVVSRSWLPGLFTDDQAVVSLTAFLFWWMAISQPINGIAFTLDGLLIGAGDLRFLAFSMVGAAAIFIPVVLGLAWNGYGIGWIWAALTLFMALRAIPLWIRYRSGKWATLGATR